MMMNDVQRLATADQTCTMGMKRNYAERSPMATQIEVHERIRLVADMLVRRIHKHQIKRALEDKYGLGARQAEVYISRAREYLVERTNRPKDEHIAEAFAFYESIIRDPEAVTADRMRAQDALRQLLGLDAPVKVANTTADGDTVQNNINVLVQQLSVEELTVLSRVRQRLLALEKGYEADSIANQFQVENLKSMEGCDRR
jgi:hypothetical protein